jgi:NCAIR mutase (PurE)-related protein
MVDQQLVRRWLAQVRRGTRAPHEFIDALRRLPYENLGFARLDTHRRLRRGLPEMVLGEGKTPAQLIRIIRRLAQLGELVLVTRLEPGVFQDIHRALPQLCYEPMARVAYQGAPRRLDGRRLSRAGGPRGLVVVVTGGTSDLPVAEEAVITLQILGTRAARLYDVGVAGVHRVLGEWRLLARARAVIVIAGMEGALASVVGGLVACPVIAVPTSIGYGASFHGVAPLLTMLNSCVPGIGVVNIDNGFGAAYLAHLVNYASQRRSSR